jgi:uncharacterized SAM-binding protein YcdF (DUF218 family)
MNILFDILVSWVQLPGIILLLYFAALLLLRWAKVAACYLFIMATALLYGLSTPWVASHLANSLERRYPPFSITTLNAHNNDRPQAIVVLGGGRRYAPEEEGGEAASLSTLLRTNYAADLQEKTHLPLFAIGAGASLTAEQKPEAQLMKKILQRKNIMRDVYLELESTNTYENALYAKPLLENFGITHFLLVTSASHMPRAMHLFQAMGFSPTAAPTDYLTNNASANTLNSWMPSAYMLNVSARIWHEYLG